MDEFDLSALPVRHYEHPVWDSARWRGFKTRSDDILICTPYKTGTTWMQMICALLIFQRPQLDRPLSEISHWMDMRSAPVDEVHATYEAQSHRRFIKTHTPLDGLPWLPQATYLCVGRDPRDVFLSLLNHRRNFNPESDAIFAREMRDSGTDRKPLPDDPNEISRQWLTTGSFPWESDGAPYWSVFRHGSTFWMHRDQPNIHFIHYGDLKGDLEGQMRRIARLLGIEVPEPLWPTLVEAASFESMKQNADLIAPDANFRMWKDNSQFFNKGSSGQWQGVLSDESLALMAQVTAKYPADFIRWLFHGGAPD